MKVFNKIICFILIFVLLTPVIVSAAEPVVTPADSGVSSTYDENYIYITYQGKTYSCNRNLKINTYNGKIGCELFYDSDKNESGKYFYLLKDTTYEIQSYEYSGKKLHIIDCLCLLRRRIGIIILMFLIGIVRNVIVVMFLVVVMFMDRVIKELVSFLILHLFQIAILI